MCKFQFCPSWITGIEKSVTVMCRHKLSVASTYTLGSWQCICLFTEAVKTESSFHPTNVLFAWRILAHGKCLDHVINTAYIPIFIFYSNFAYKSHGVYIFSICLLLPHPSLFPSEWHWFPGWRCSWFNLISFLKGINASISMQIATFWLVSSKSAEELKIPNYSCSIC